MKSLITGIHIPSLTQQLPALLYKDVDEADTDFGVLLNISNADGRGNMGDDQMIFVKSGKDFFR
jgi:hypothetical protein